MLYKRVISQKANRKRKVVNVIDKFGSGQEFREGEQITDK